MTGRAKPRRPQKDVGSASSVTLEEKRRRTGAALVGGARTLVRSRVGVHGSDEASTAGLVVLRGHALRVREPATVVAAIVHVGLELDLVARFDVERRRPDAPAALGQLDPRAVGVACEDELGFHGADLGLDPPFVA